MINRGLVIGKFYPPHKGHNYLINYALERSNKLTVLVCWNTTQNIPVSWRVDCLKEIHPNAEIIAIEDKPAEDDSEGWAKYTIETLGYIPDTVFTSEDYGELYSKYMGCEHILVDKERLIIPVSGTKIRNDPYNNLEYMEPCVRSRFIKRIVLIGAESTGKTTLAKELANHYKTNMVEEYGREYALSKDKFNKPWFSEEFTHIAEEQSKRETLLKRESNKIIICDTDAFATSIWHRRYMGFRSIIESEKDGLYLLTDVNTPFYQDGTRDGEHIRQEMHNMFLEELVRTKRLYCLISGNKKERFNVALNLIDGLETFPY